MFFNFNTQYDNLVFGSPKKTKDNKYFLKIHQRIDNKSPGMEVFCQFGPKLQANSKIENGFDVLVHENKHCEFIREIEDYVVSVCKERKSEWFMNDDSESISDAYIDNAFMSSIKSTKKQNIFKVRTSSTLECFNNSKEEIDKSVIDENSKVTIICQLEGVWFTKTRFGLTWKLKQLKLFTPVHKKISGFMFSEEEEEEVDDNVFPDE